MSVSVLIEAVEAEGFGGRDVVPPAFQGWRLRGPGPSRTRAKARGSSLSKTTRIVFSSGARYRPVIGSHGARSLARSARPARRIHCPTAVNRSFPAAVNAQTATAIRQASG